MSYDVDTPDDTDSTAFDPAGSDGGIEITYPSGGSEHITPDYEILVAVDPEEFYGPYKDSPAVSATDTTRLEVTCEEKPDGDAVLESVELAFTRFVQYGHSIDGLVEKVYVRSIDGVHTLCLVLRSPDDESHERSQLALALDEELRGRFGA